MNKCFYFLRHGQTDWNYWRRLQGMQDVCLNDVGRFQCHKIAELVESLGQLLVLCSPLQRAKQSCQIIFPNVLPKVRYVESLAEFPCCEQQRAHDGSSVGAGENSLSDVGGNFNSLIESITTDLLHNDSNENIIVVSHGSIFEYLCRQLNLPPLRLNNAALVEVSVLKEKNQTLTQRQKPTTLTYQDFLWKLKVLHPGFKIDNKKNE